MSFKIGDEVVFYAENYGTADGVVMGFTDDFVLVENKPFVVYTVSPELLTKNTGVEDENSNI